MHAGPCFLMLDVVQESGARCQAGRASVVEKAAGRKSESTRLMSEPTYFWVQRGNKRLGIFSGGQEGGWEQELGVRRSPRRLSHTPRAETGRDRWSSRSPRSPVLGAVELRGRKRLYTHPISQSTSLLSQTQKLHKSPSDTAIPRRKGRWECFARSFRI